MKVERLDVYDFKVTLTESEFKDVKYIASERNENVDEIIAWFIEYGLTYLSNDYL